MAAYGNAHIRSGILVTQARSDHRLDHKYHDNGRGDAGCKGDERAE
jgi:hypothetical protein